MSLMSVKSKKNFPNELCKYNLGVECLVIGGTSYMKPARHFPRKKTGDFP